MADTASPGNIGNVSPWSINGRGLMRRGAVDPDLEYAAGTISGVTCINKFGENPTVSQNTMEDIWDGGGTYPFPATADITHVVQAADQAAMRGQMIEVQGLGTDWALVIQNVTLDASNTTTAVPLTTALRRNFRMMVLADVVTDQDIHAKNIGGGTTYATILAGNNGTLMAVYTVPGGKTAYITNYYADQIPGAAGTKDPNRVEFRLWIADRDNSYEFQLSHSKATTATGSSEFQHFFKPYFKVTQKSDIKMTATPSNDRDAHVHAGFDLILVDNI